MIHELKLGEKTYTLRFNIGTLDHLRQLADVYPTAFAGVTSDKPWGIIDQVKAIITAGLRSEWDYKGVSYELSQEEITKQVMNLETEDAVVVVQIYADSYNPKKQSNGEVKNEGEKKLQWKEG